MSEQWRPVVGYEGYYEVSDQGRVRSLPRSIKGRWGGTVTRPGRVLTPFRDRYAKIQLRVDGVVSSRYVHRLVAEAFIGPCPDGFEVCHNNGDPFDNRLENLRYDTHSANVWDTIRHGRHPGVNRTHCAQGHPFDEANTHRFPNGRRRCLTCHRERGREASRRKRLQESA